MKISINARLVVPAQHACRVGQGQEDRTSSWRDPQSMVTWMTENPQAKVIICPSGLPMLACRGPLE
ncbi:hypothetical protein [Desulfoplanes formicivorans]|uniref:hypothetical protein n=1 Tax=Desulfoplanes formicivorans TaxID=1592317 RepID=UPI00114C963C|nr:hypothetical protein [Desulfoplanes formicivorans]